jgi:hypothetical protein
LIQALSGMGRTGITGMTKAANQYDKSGRCHDKSGKWYYFAAFWAAEICSL